MIKKQHQNQCLNHNYMQNIWKRKIRNNY